VPRQDGRRAGAIRIIARPDLGWLWFIPISATLMSVGVVLPRAAVDRLARMAPDELLERTIRETPAAAVLMREATREWPVRVEKDFSFGARAYAGDRWLLVGDAGSFLDPVFSTGVAIALESGVEAGRALDRALASGDLSARAFAPFNRRQQKRYLAFRRFVLGFYTRGFRELFFVPAPPPRIFRALVTTLAGYWHPSVATRVLQTVFFLLVRLRERFPATPRPPEISSGA
jgi:2-polyprenyl-6-methoxyphenol hydroxylase-like FAD-dependent oxidoreductase